MTKKKEKNLLEKLNLNFNKMLIGSIILNVLFLIFGFILYLNPRTSLEALGVFLGIYLVIFGIFSIVEYLSKEVKPLYGLNLIWGIIAIIIGLFAIINPLKLSTILTLALGIYLIVLAISKTIEAFKLKKLKYDGWLLMLVIAIILLVFSIFIIINPIISAMEITEVAGIFIILASILEICNSIMLYTKAKDILKLLK